MPIETRPPPERAFLVAVETKGPRRSRWPASASLDELALLSATAGAEVVGRLVQSLPRPHKAHYLGLGKLKELSALKGQLNYNLVIFDDELSPSQQQNLEEALGVKVVDRTALILDIFSRRARTREGQLQVELAQNQYQLTRLPHRWPHLERLGGGIGTRGPGETQLESDRRLLARRIQHLKRELEAVRRHRSLYRRRRARTGIPVVALVGYTNVGKSTLLNALTRAGVFVEDKLFATLDPTTRRLQLPHGRQVLLTDTVGFIQKLPPIVVAAFRATLEELQEADLLLHLVDITHPEAPRQSQTVEETLEEMGLGERPRITVLNKIDLLPGGDGENPENFKPFVDQFTVLKGTSSEVEGHSQWVVAISAAKGWGLEELMQTVALALPGPDTSVS